MTATVITGIGELVTNAPGGPDLLGTITDAALVVEGSHVAWVGPAADAPAADERVEAGGRTVLVAVDQNPAPPPAPTPAQ